jgi:putative membrane protein
MRNYMQGQDVGAWGWFAFSIGMLVLLALFTVLVYVAVRAVGGPAPRTPTPRMSTPEVILAERFARGEIDEAEYQRRLAALRGIPQER